MVENCGENFAFLLAESLLIRTNTYIYILALFCFVDTRVFNETKQRELELLVPCLNLH